MYHFNIHGENVVTYARNRATPYHWLKKEKNKPKNPNPNQFLFNGDTSLEHLILKSVISCTLETYYCRH